MGWRKVRNIGKGVSYALLGVFLVLPYRSVAQGAHKASALACPPDAIRIRPGLSIQAAVEHAGDGATLCLESGIYRAQTIRPRPGQHFIGEGRAVLDGSTVVSDFIHDGRFWVALMPTRKWRPHGECADRAPACNRPEALFIDDVPLVPAARKTDVRPGAFFADPLNGNIFFVDNPSGHKVEATAARVAFVGSASNVTINNIIIEKYGTRAQEGAIEAQTAGATNWTVEDCEVRLNSGGGIAVGVHTRVRNSNIHHNGQIGITGVGEDVLIENNSVGANNTRGFATSWEAGGIKLASSERVTFRGNYVHDNAGPGIWCDIGCKNVIYERNLVEANQGHGIFHEISFDAMIRDNTVRHNGTGNTGWFWGVNILIAASQNVVVNGNTLTVSAGGCGILLIDQSRNRDDGGKYKTRNNARRCRGVGRNWCSGISSRARLSLQAARSMH
jgi:Right handed beta helix region